MKTFLKNLAWAVLMLLFLGAVIALDNPPGGPSPAEVRGLP